MLSVNLTFPIPSRHDPHSYCGVREQSGKLRTIMLVKRTKSALGALVTGCALTAFVPMGSTDIKQEVYPEPAQILTWSPERRLRTFSDYAGTFPTRTIHAGGRPHPLAGAPLDLSAVSYEIDDGRYSLDDFVRETRVAGMIVVKDDRVRYERYELGNDASSLWVSYSIAKSVVSLLYGAALADGFIASLDEPVTRYLPRLAGGAYDGVTIEQLLQMSSGVAWNEDYEDREADVSQAPTAILPFIDYMRALPTAAPPGTVFNYSTGETDLAGAVLRAAIGNNLSTYLTHRIWRPFGMAADANWLLGEPGGVEFGGYCISATLRDYARLGILALNGGRTADGRELLPADWMARSISPADTYPGYGYLWWLRPGGDYAAIGIFGQLIWIDPGSNSVIAIHSAWPQPTSEHLAAHRWAMVDALAEVLGQEDL